MKNCAFLNSYFGNRGLDEMTSQSSFQGPWILEMQAALLSTDTRSQRILNLISFT